MAQCDGHAVNWDIKMDYYDDEDSSKLAYLPKITLSLPGRR